MQQDNEMYAEIYGRTMSINAPGGFIIDFREQNGEDDDIISNPVTAKDLSNWINFLLGLIVKIDGKKPTKMDIENLPVNTKYAVMIASRIFSLGSEVHFTHHWSDMEEPYPYSVDLDQYLFEDYHQLPDEETLNSKPDAVPYYPDNIHKDISLVLSTGKQLMYDRYNTYSERYILSLPLDQRTNNKSLVARNLRLFDNVKQKWTKVENFRLFTAKEMQELKREIFSNDPIFSGSFNVAHPDYPDRVDVENIMAIPDFFFPGEAQ